MAKKKEIVYFFRGKDAKRSSSPKTKTLEQMRHRFTKITNLKSIYNWEKLLKNGNSKWIDFCFRFPIFETHFKRFFVNTTISTVLCFKNSKKIDGVVYVYMIGTWRPGPWRRAEKSIWDFEHRITGYWTLNFKRRHNIVSHKITRQIFLMDETKEVDAINYADSF